MGYIGLLTCVGHQGNNPYKANLAAAVDLQTGVSYNLKIGYKDSRVRMWLDGVEKQTADKDTDPPVTSPELPLSIPTDSPALAM